jgi:hypothetical protein
LAALGEASQELALIGPQVRAESAMSSEEVVNHRADSNNS